MKNLSILLWVIIYLLMTGVSWAQEGAQTLYRKVYEAYLKGDYAATADLASIYLTIKEAPLKEDVLNLSSLSLIKLGRLEEARQKLKELEGDFKDKEKAEALMSIGDSYYYEGHKQLALESYEEVLRKYPHNANAHHLEEKIKEVRHQTGKG